MHADVPAEFQVIRYAVPDFIGDTQRVAYGDPRHPRLAQLREEYGLEAVVAGCRTEFEGFLALKRWVRSRWDHGFSLRRPEIYDGLGLLQEVAKGEQFCCGDYMRLYVDAATALGWPARPVGIGIRDSGAPRDYNLWNTGHGVAEIWSNEHRKWVVMDPDLNIHYERDGVPLHALEIREAWLEGDAEQVEMVQDRPLFVLPSPEQVEIARQDPTCRKDYDEEVNRLIFERFNRHRAMDYYVRLHIAGWSWVDRHCLPAFVYHFRPTPAYQWTSNKADLYGSVNMVRIAARSGWDASGSRLMVTLSHCMPFFDTYEVRIDGGEWRRSEPGFEWRMREGVNSIQCRGVNVMRRPGIVSEIAVAHARPPRVSSD